MYITGLFNWDLLIFSAVLSCIILYMLGSFHLQRVNKLYRKYTPVRITQQKEHLLIWNSETAQNLNIYLHNYQTQTAIFLATKTIGMTCSYLSFSIQKIHQNSKKWWLAFVRNCLVKMTLRLF